MSAITNFTAQSWKQNVLSLRFCIATAILLFAFTAVGLVLAIGGVYGVMARVARARSREIGIRVALGA